MLGRRNIRAYVQPYNGELRIHIRRFEGSRPTKSGIALLIGEWSDLKASINQLDYEITRQQVRTGGAFTRTPYQRQDANQANDPEFDLEAVIHTMMQSTETTNTMDNNVNITSVASEPLPLELIETFPALNSEAFQSQPLMNIDENANFAWGFNELLDNIISEKKE